MKTLKNLVLILVCCLSSLIIACNRQKTLKTVTVPFVADALGEYKYVGPDTLPNPKCSDSLSAWRAIVDVKGTGTPVGKFTAYFDFCGDAESHYGNAFAYLVAENGDTLFIDASGQVLEGRLDEHPEFVISYWKDSINITDGTGKYKGARGSIITNDYNSSEDLFSHHHWSGTLTLPQNQ
jgi:hypothetical protein